MFKNAEKESEDKIKNLRSRVKRRISFDGTDLKLLPTNMLYAPRKATLAKSGRDAE